ncbi:ABC transporter permease [Nocardioides sp.]|uniref:ABC transporter permease n=1 Tax=Nocardioides sp. TaxID=35761 RepID=UPI0035290768
MTATTVAAREAPANRRSATAELLSWPGTRALIAVLALFAVSPLFATGSVSRIALLSMLPFAALTATVAIGQTLVIQQGGLDLSIPGAVTLAALIVAKFGAADSWGLTTAVLVAILGTSLFGMLSGLVVAVFGLPPLVVTIASQALLVGMVQAVSGGFGAQVTPQLSSFALSRYGGIPVLALFAVALVVVVHVVLKLTRVGGASSWWVRTRTARATSGSRAGPTSSRRTGWPACWRPSRA